MLSVSCSSKETETAVAPTSTTGPYPYPGPQTAYQEPKYPEPQDTTGGQQAPTTTPLPTVTPAPDTGVVVGVILYNGEPVARYTLYLAEVIKDEQGQDSVAALKRISSPRTATNDQGQFVFLNVPPGKYGLVLDLVQSAYLLHDPKSNEQIILTVTANEEVDIGTFDFEDLPIP